MALAEVVVDQLATHLCRSLAPKGPCSKAKLTRWDCHLHVQLCQLSQLYQWSLQFEGKDLCTVVKENQSFSYFSLSLRELSDSCLNYANVNVHSFNLFPPRVSLNFVSGTNGR